MMPSFSPPLRSSAFIFFAAFERLRHDFSPLRATAFFCHAVLRHFDDDAASVSMPLPPFFDLRCHFH